MKALTLFALLPWLACAAPVLDDVRPTTCVPDYAKRGTAVIGTLNPELFAADRLQLTLPDAGDVSIAKTRASEREWIGQAPGATLTFTKPADVVTGTLNKDGRTWELMPQCDGFVLYEVDAAPWAEPATPPPAYRPPDFDAPAVRGPTNVDALILYTQAAAAKWTEPVLQSKIATAIANSNAWMTQSGATVGQTAVAVLPSPLQESGSGMAQTCANLKNSAEVAAMRANHHADVVTLISTDSGGYAGYAQMTWYASGSALTAYEAHAVVGSNWLGDQTLAHETGHMLALDHNRENAGGTAPGFHYGYRVCATDGSGFRDIMSYQCSSGVPRISYFSNPALTYNGQPLGIAYAADPAHASENARTLNENAPKFAAFRNPQATQPPPPGPVPAAPQNLIATPTGGAVVLTWGYADNQATSAALQRAKKNKGGKWSSYSSIGTVNAPANSYTDRPAAGTYRYLVTARNASGASPAAGPVGATL